MVRVLDGLCMIHTALHVWGLVKQTNGLSVDVYIEERIWNINVCNIIATILPVSPELIARRGTISPPQYGGGAPF